jgi:hypothetical protein
MKVKQTQHHRMDITREYDLDEQILAEYNLTEDDVYGILAEDDSVAPEKYDYFYDMINEIEPSDVTEDLWTDRKGGYDISYIIED